MKLDSRTVAGLALPDDKADVIHFDSALAGFGYRLRRSGNEVRRSWIVQYRRAGASRRLLLGSAEVLSADQARGAAKQVLAKIALGEDPQADKASRRAADKFTVAALAEEFLAAKDGTTRPRTFVEACRYLRGGYFKPLHAMPIDQVERRDVAARLLAIARESAIGQGLLDHNPVVGTNRPKTPPPRDRVLDDGELAAVWNGAGDDDFGRIVRLLILTGQRRTEVGGMRWQEIDRTKATWTIPAGRAKNGREHTLPLTPLALDIIASAPRIVGRDYLFGPRAAGFTSWNRPKQMLDARLGDQIKPWTLHDLRRTCATRMCDLGVAPHVVEQILNHQSGHRAGVVGVYNKSRYEAEVKAALALWSDHLCALIQGGKRKIVSMRP
jgi:integrase